MTDKEYFVIIATFCYPEFAPTQKTCDTVSALEIDASKKCDACIYNDSFVTGCKLDPKYTDSSYDPAFLLKVIEHNPEHLI
jgi:hypothetical protein